MNDESTGAGPAASDGAPPPLIARSLGASLTVADLEVSLGWYRDILGFAVDRRHEHEGVLRAVSLRAGDVRILIGQDDGAKGMDREEGVGMSLMLTTSQDIAELAARVTAHGGEFTTPPTSTPWGARMFRLKDPDGFLLVISSG